MTPFSLDDFCELLDQKAIGYTCRAQAMQYLGPPSLYLEYDVEQRFGLYNYWDLCRGLIEAASGELAALDTTELDDILDDIANLIERVDQGFRSISLTQLREIVLCGQDVRPWDGLKHPLETTYYALRLEVYVQCVSVFWLLNDKFGNNAPELTYTNG